MFRTITLMIAIATIGTSLAFGVTFAHADDMSPEAKMIYDDVQKTLGGVPSFIKKLPVSALGGLWKQEKELELSDKTALPPKTKALIALAVAAQIPCTYCIWSDTMTAKQLGATDAEIGEAVAMAGLTRNASTVLNGLQIDFEQFKKEMGGQ